MVGRGFLGYLALLIGAGLAQVPRLPAVVSPEVLADRRVTFRLYAPKATEVLLTGEWMGPREKPAALLKGDDGVCPEVTGAKRYLVAGIWSGLFRFQEGRMRVSGKQDPLRSRYEGLSLEQVTSAITNALLPGIE